MSDEEKHAGGRPLLFETPEDLEAAIEQYFKDFKENDETGCPTINGMALHIGMDRRSIINYEQRDEFFPIIKNARTKLEEGVERFLLDAKAKGHVAGAIFWLKNNAGWVDKTTQEHELGEEATRFVMNLK